MYFIGRIVLNKMPDNFLPKPSKLHSVRSISCRVLILAKAACALKVLLIIIHKRGSFTAAKHPKSNSIFSQPMALN